jgi:hypothetical protein
LAISTCGDLIAFCFRASGVNGQGQSASAEDSADALTTLAAMVAQWQRKRWLVPSLTDFSVLSTGAQSYTVGPAGDFVMPRPDRIESAFVRLNPTSALPIDYPLTIIEAHEDYNAIQVKSLSTFPSTVFYDSAFPVGSVFFYPVPPANLFELHLTVKAALPVFAALTDDVAQSLPPEYIDALKYSLIVRMAADWGMTPKPAHVLAARAALNTIRMANVQVGVLAMPAGLAGRARGSAGFVGQGLGRAFTLDGGSVLT